MSIVWPFTPLQKVANLFRKEPALLLLRHTCFVVSYVNFRQILRSALFSDHETAIMHRLQTVILEHTKVLMDVMECCAELDW